MLTPNELTDSQEAVVEPQPTEGEGNPEAKPKDEPAKPVEAEGGTEGGKEREVADPDKAVQSLEENTAFKEMRLKMESLEKETQQARRDAMYLKKYPDLDFETEADLAVMYGEHGITSYEDLDEYYANLEQAEKMEVSPELLTELTSLRKKVDQLTSEKQRVEDEQKIEPLRKELAEQYGDIYTDNEADILRIAESMGMKNEAGLKASTASILADKFPSYMKAMEEKLAKAKEEGVKEFIESKKNEAPIEGGGLTPASVGNKPKDAWAEARKNALEALRPK